MYYLNRRNLKNRKFNKCSNFDIDDGIRQIVENLNCEGYKIIHACSGFVMDHGHKMNLSHITFKFNKEYIKKIINAADILEMNYYISGCLWRKSITVYISDQYRNSTDATKLKVLNKFCDNLLNEKSKMLNKNK